MWMLPEAKEDLCAGEPGPCSTFPVTLHFLYTARGSETSQSRKENTEVIKNIEIFSMVESKYKKDLCN